MDGNTTKPQFLKSPEVWASLKGLVETLHHQNSSERSQPLNIGLCDLNTVSLLDSLDDNYCAAITKVQAIRTKEWKLLFHPELKKYHQECTY